MNITSDTTNATSIKASIKKNSSNARKTLKAAVYSAMLASVIAGQVTAVQAKNVDTTQTQNKKERIEKAAVVTSTATFGALAGGPIGFAFGIIGGALINDYSSKQEAKKMALHESAATITALETAVIQQEVEMEKLEQIVQQKLHLKVRFETGSDKLTTYDEENLAAFSEMLHDNPKLNVRLDGYTDPRGTDEYNNVLSLERARAVAGMLEDYGIAPERINAYGHGSAQVPNLLSVEDYTEHRRVDIETFTVEETTGFVSID